MKKLLLLIVILIIVAGCAKQPVFQPYHKFPVLAMGEGNNG
jgi:uncharacterized lipoprotein YajG